MPAIIESVVTTVSHRPFWRRGALRLADDAVTECLHRVRRSPAEVDLLINAGVYREKNLAEPALAAMIQEDIGANLGHPPVDRSHGTFSFDVDNGGAGVLTAFQLADGFIQSRTIDLGAVVASDSDPGHVEHFPFPSVGGAVLLGRGTGDSGFSSFAFETFPEHARTFDSVVAWRPTEHPNFLSPAGRNVLEITVREDFPARALDCALGTVRRFLEARGLRPNEIDLLVASAYPETFAPDLARRLEIPPGRVAAPGEALRGAHTAGVIAALESAFHSGQLAVARNTLFVTVGAGITVAAALYRHT